MHFFVYSRVAPHVADLEDDPDRAAWTGSVHIVDLPSPDAARAFVEHEPYNRLGLFDHHLIRRFTDRLGRTMWEFPGGSEDPRFLVIAQGPAAAARLADLTALRERLIVHGDLLTAEEAAPAGVVVALQAPGPQAVKALLRLDVQVLAWEFGGRR